MKFPGLQSSILKNDLFGSQAEAVEIYPKEKGRLNTEGTYHLWVMPSSVKLSFGLGKNLKLVPRGKRHDITGFMVEMARIFGME